MVNKHAGWKPRHRGTWSTVFILVLFAIGVCAVVFGFFSLPASTLRGLAMMSLGVGLVIPGVWWLRWYQNTHLLLFVLPAAAFFFIPGTFGIAMDIREGESAPETVVADQEETTPTPSSKRTTTTTKPTTTSSETTPTSTAETTATPEPSSPVTELVPTTVIVPSTVIVTSRIPVAPAPAPVQPPAAADPPAPAPVPAEPTEEPIVSEPPPTETPPAQTPDPVAPAPAPAAPWDDLINQVLP